MTMVIDDNSNYDEKIKIVMIGDSGVGKSCIFSRFGDNMFHSDFVPTIGVDFTIKIINIDGRKVKLHIWDTAGQERFTPIVSSYYRGAQGMILVYDITDRNSFKHIDKWLHEIERSGDPSVKKILVGNKTDVTGKREVTYVEGKKYADELGIPFLEVSAKMSTNVKEIFHTLIRSIIPAKILKSNNNNSSRHVNLNNKTAIISRCKC